MDRMLVAAVHVLLWLSISMATYWLVRFIQISVLHFRVRASMTIWTWVVSGALVASSVWLAAWALNQEAYTQWPLWLYLLTVCGTAMMWVYGFFATLATVDGGMTSYREHHRTLPNVSA